MPMNWTIKCLATGRSLLKSTVSAIMRAITVIMVDINMVITAVSRHLTSLLRLFYTVIHFISGFENLKLI